MINNKIVSSRKESFPELSLDLVKFISNTLKKELDGIFISKTIKPVIENGQTYYATKLLSSNLKHAVPETVNYPNGFFLGTTGADIERIRTLLADLKYENIGKKFVVMEAFILSTVSIGESTPKDDDGIRKSFKELLESVTGYSGDHLCLEVVVIRDDVERKKFSYSPYRLNREIKFNFLQIKASIQLMITENFLESIKDSMD